MDTQVTELSGLEMRAGRTDQSSLNWSRLRYDVAQKVTCSRKRETMVCVTYHLREKRYLRRERRQEKEDENEAMVGDDEGGGAVVSRVFLSRHEARARDTTYVIALVIRSA